MVPFFRLKNAPKILFFFILILLGISVVRSGLYYQFDIDEISYAQYSYLFSRGHLPYRDFHLTVMPFFSGMLTSLFGITGYNFDSLIIARGLMVFIFFLRIGILYLLLRKLFDPGTAAIFIPLLLFDPFTQFTGMQIRPDNLMLLLFTAGLLTLYKGTERNSHRLVIAAGILISMSVLVLLKILPAAAAVFLFITVKGRLTGKNRHTLWFATGALIPLALAAAYFGSKGLIPQVYQQTLLDRKAFNDSLLNPTPPFFFYRGGNFELFGYPGKPLTWIYVWLLPAAASIAAFGELYKYLRKGRKPGSNGEMFRVLMAVLLFVQWAAIFAVRGFFSQYFLLVTWLWAAFAASLVRSASESFPFKPLFVVIFAFFALVSIGANLNRAKVSHGPYRVQMNRLWQIVPAQEKTFPNILFRPSSYPVVLGTFIGDVPQGILKRYGTVHKNLEENRVKYLLLDPYIRQYLGPDTNGYIDENYTELPSEKGIYMLRRE